MCDNITALGSAQFEGLQSLEHPSRDTKRDGWVRFDPQKRAGSPRLKAAVEALIADLEAHEARLKPRKHRRTQTALTSYRLASEAIAANLLWSTLDPLGRPLAVPRDAATLRGKSRYKPACYGLAFTDVLGLLAHPEVDLAHDLTRGYSYKGGHSAPSTIGPTDAFLARYAPPDLTWQDLRREADPEVLILKEPREGREGGKRRIEFEDTGRTKKLRRDVERINCFLLRAPIFLLPGPPGGDLDTLGQPMDPLRRTVRRVFNDASWLKNGRLYGAFWINMPKADRFQRLRLGSAAHPEGEQLVSCDFKQFNVRAAYHLANEPIPPGDLYDIDGGGQNRETYKKLTNAMLNAGKRLQNLPRDVQAALPPGVKAKDAIAAIERHHAPIAQLFWTGAGFQLAAIESAILIDCLHALHKENVTALPLHDAILCPRSEASRVCDVMEIVSGLYGEGLRARPSIEEYH